MDQSNSGSLVIVLFWLGLLLPLLDMAVVLVGTLLRNDVVRWLGVPVGIGIGVLLAWGFSRIASQCLEAHGPELLSLMRHGKSKPAKRTEVKATGARLIFWSTMPGWKVLLLTALLNSTRTR